MALISFASFFENWLVEKQTIVQELEALISPNAGFDRALKCSEMIPRVLSHYQKFYHEKSIAAGEDVSLILSPKWLTSFECSLLWISGFRPSTLFQLLVTAVVVEELSDEKRLRIEAAKAETRRREREITQAMARIQETVAEPPLYDLMKKFARLVEGRRSEFEEATEELKTAMKVVVSEADQLRVSTAVWVVELLDSVEAVKFLAAALRFELQARKWGVENDCRRAAADGPPELY